MAKKKKKTRAGIKGGKTVRKTKALAKVKTAKKAQDDVLKEISRLGKSIEDALKAAATSKKAKAISNEVSKSLKSVSKQLTGAVESAKKSEETRRVAEQAKKVYRTGKNQGEATAKKVQGNLAKGLRSLSDELTKLAKKVKKS